MRYLGLFIFFTIFGCKTTKSDLPMENSPVAKNGFLSINEQFVVNEKGEKVSFAGNSFFWSNEYYKGFQFYNKENVQWLQKDWHSTIIRVPVAAEPDIHDSYIFEKDFNYKKLETLVDAAIAQGMYVIVDWHSQKAEQNEKEAIAFFERVAKQYGKYPNIIYEIYNEPLKISWDNVIKPYAENVIKAIRKIDKKNIIVVGTPHWSQDVDQAALNPIKGQKNIAYTLHFYADSHFDWLLQKAQKAIDLKLPIIVTEWGTVKANGDGKVNKEWTEKWMQFMKRNNLTHCNWSVHDKVEGASILKPNANINGNWNEEDLTESGKLVKSYIKNWGQKNQ